MKLQRNFQLRQYNTFGIDVSASYFSRFSSESELAEVLSLWTTDSSLPALILGGGSNILFTKNFNGLILKNEVKGIEKIHEDDQHFYIRAGAGENWHQFVLFCIQNNWAGVENLSLIPGNVGASPMQNIGAYGVEVRDVFFELRAFHLAEKLVQTFNAADCGFGYRESVFKNKYSNQFAVLDVTFRLDKTPRFNTAYGAVEQELAKMGVSDLTTAAVSRAVINIRTSKLPDPAIVGNAGSFFKNPSIAGQQFEELRQRFENMIGYPNQDGSVKLAAGWLIEQCGWKGFRRGEAGCHDRQALVLVNYGKATGMEVYALSEEIRDSVKHKFDVELEREVNIV